MLIKRSQLDAIVRGEIDLAFRKWKRPTVKAGGTLKTAVGVLAIRAVEPTTERAITTALARRAGFDDRAALLAELAKRDGDLHRIELHYVGDDPRIALRNATELSATDRAELRAKLDRYDKASRQGPWTDAVLQCIARRPAELAANLAADLGFEKAWFKTNVRKLKALGLTESLDVGYRISPRGHAFLGSPPARRKNRG